MKAIRLKIIDLLDKHPFGCAGCSTCEEIERLGKMLERDPVEKCSHILAKGKDMTRSDIAFLLEMEVNKRSISKALKMDQTEFSLLMRNWGFAKKKQKEVEEVAAKINLTVDEYNDLKLSGYKDKKIAEIKGIKPTALANWKWNNGIKAPSKCSEKPVIDNKPTPKTETPKEDKTAEMRQLINDLSDELQRERKAKEWAQQEYARVLSELEQKDYELQNLLGKHADVYSSLIKLEKESRALKELVKVWI
jgi:hypothetical protein